MNEQDFTRKARDLVYDDYIKRYPETDLKPSEIYIVWNCKVLQNNKALLSTPYNDGLYYEITYNGHHDEFYIDVYEKKLNKAVSNKNV